MLRGNERKDIFEVFERNLKKSISERRNKYYKDDLMLALKRQSNLSIREVLEILGINRGMVASIKV